MKNKKEIVMKKEKKELVTLLAIIATGVTCVGILLGGTTLSFVGASMYFLPIYVWIVGNKYF